MRSALPSKLKTTRASSCMAETSLPGHLSSLYVMLQVETSLLPVCSALFWSVAPTAGVQRRLSASSVRQSSVCERDQLQAVDECVVLLDTHDEGKERAVERLVFGKRRHVHEAKERCPPFEPSGGSDRGDLEDVSLVALRPQVAPSRATNAL